MKSPLDSRYEIWFDLVAEFANGTRTCEANVYAQASRILVSDADAYVDCDADAQCVYARIDIIFVSDADAYADCDADAQCVYAHISRIFVSDSDAYADCDFCI